MKISVKMQAKLDAAAAEYEFQRHEVYRITGAHPFVPTCPYKRPCYVVRWYQSMVESFKGRIAAFTAKPEPFYKRGNFSVQPVTPDTLHKCKTCQGHGRIRAQHTKTGWRRCYECMGLGRITVGARELRKLSQSIDINQ